MSIIATPNSGPTPAPTPFSVGIFPAFQISEFSLSANFSFNFTIQAFQPSLIATNGTSAAVILITCVRCFVNSNVVYKLSALPDGIDATLCSYLDSNTIKCPAPQVATWGEKKMR